MSYVCCLIDRQEAASSQNAKKKTPKIWRFDGHGSKFHLDTYSISQLFPLPCGVGSTVPREVFNLSVIILASFLIHLSRSLFFILVFPMLGCRHFLLRYCNISCFPQVECTLSNIPTCVHFLLGGHYLVFLVLTFSKRGCTAGASSICWSL